LPTQANSLQDPILNIPNTKKDWWGGLNVEHLLSKHEAEFKPQYLKIKKKENLSHSKCH
jgi:hypothetical protein